MKIYAIRHGLTHSNKLRILNGQAIDEGLEPEGIPAVEEAARKLPAGLSKMYVSDMMRTRQTAEILNREIHIPVSFHPEIREVDFGILSGRQWKDIKEEYGEQIWNSYKDQNYDFTPYNGHSFVSVKNRVSSLLSQIKSNHSANEKVLLVAHGGILRLLYHLYKDEHYEGAENASLHEFEI